MRRELTTAEKVQFGFAAFTALALISAAVLAAASTRWQKPEEAQKVALDFMNRMTNSGPEALRFFLEFAKNVLFPVGLITVVRDLHNGRHLFAGVPATRALDQRTLLDNADSTNNNGTAAV